MKKKASFSAIALIIGILIGFSGCSTIGLYSGKEQEASQPVNEYRVLPPENDRMNTVIVEYLKKLYSNSVDSYISYDSSGQIPENIKPLIAQNTIKIAEGNPEIGIHFPKAVVLNGLVAGSYEILMNKTAAGQSEPEIEISYVGTKSENYLFYVKVNLLAECIDINEVLKAVNQNSDSATEVILKNALENGDYTNLSMSTQNIIRQKALELIIEGDNQSDSLDKIKLQAKYNFELLKENSNFKIASAREVTATSQNSIRNSLFSNEYIERLPYLNIENSYPGIKFISKEDQETFSKESLLIKSFFDNLRVNLNSENMRLLLPMWNKSLDTFAGYLDRVCIPINNSKKMTELMELNANYKSKFDYEALPLKLNMEKMKSDFTSFNVIQHPGYTLKKKRYIVNFEVPVERINGTVGGYDTSYCFSYDVYLYGSGPMQKIDSIKLNEYYQKRN